MGQVLPHATGSGHLSENARDVGPRGEGRLSFARYRDVLKGAQVFEGYKVYLFHDRNSDLQRT